MRHDRAFEPAAAIWLQQAGILRRRQVILVIPLLSRVIGTRVIPGSATLSASGNFTVPDFNELFVYLWGGGGEGGQQGGNSNGSNGGATTFAGLSAGGGQGGRSNGTAGSALGVAAGGDININGNPGAPGNVQFGGGKGGSAPQNGGAGGNGGASGGDGISGGTPGGGGGGQGNSPAFGITGGGGGQSGAFVAKTFRAGQLTPGAIMAVVVGLGGGGHTRAGDGGDGFAGFVWT